MSKKTILKDFADLAQMWKDKRDGRRQAAYQNARTALCVVPGNRVLNIVAIKKGQQRPNGKGKATTREVFVTTNEVENYPVPGSLGAKTTEKIQQVIDTGKMPAAEKAREYLKEEARKAKGAKMSPSQEAFETFKSIHDVGEKTAAYWLKEYQKIPVAERPTPLAWLKKNQNKLKAQPSSREPGLTASQRIGIKYFVDLNKRIPRRKITIIQIIIRLALDRAFGKDSYQFAVAGSYRRGNEDSGDIDIILSSEKFTLEQAVEVLRQPESCHPDQEGRIIVETISLGSKKFMGICHCPAGGQHYHIDIVLTPRSQWEAALLWFTGSKGLNTKTRGIATKHVPKWKLNERGLFVAGKEDDGEQIARTEREIFAKLGMEYVPVECR